MCSVYCRNAMLSTKKWKKSIINSLYGPGLMSGGLGVHRALFMPSLRGESNLHLSISP